MCICLVCVECVWGSARCSRDVAWSSCLDVMKCGRLGGKLKSAPRPSVKYAARHQTKREESAPRYSMYTNRHMCTLFPHAHIANRTSHAYQCNAKSSATHTLTYVTYQRRALTTIRIMCGKSRDARKRANESDI